MTGSVGRSTLRASKPGLNYDFAPPFDFSADETCQLITRRAVAGDHAELDHLLLHFGQGLDGSERRMNFARHLGRRSRGDFGSVLASRHMYSGHWPIYVAEREEF
jgi:hypothetical protein